MRSYYPRQLPAWFGLVRVRSPLLTESIFLSLPPGTEMFQFPGLARVLPDQSPFDGSPEIIAVCHALEPPGAKTSPTRPYELGRTTPNPVLQTFAPATHVAGSPAFREESWGTWLRSFFQRSSSFQGPCLNVSTQSLGYQPQGCRKDATRITTLSKIATGRRMHTARSVHIT